VTLSPDPSTGLSGGAYLSTHVEERGWTPTELHSPGVYALELSTPTGGHETYARRWLEYFDTTPAYLDQLVDADRVLYVGASADVYERLLDHVEGKVRKSVLPTVFPIHHVETVRLFDSADGAFAREHGVALELGNDLPNAYVHSR